MSRLHGLTILLGAFLLFLIQPLFSKRILPGYGGGPEVWTICLLFFQAALFAGYLYAFLSERFLSPIVRGLVHLALLGVAAWTLPPAAVEASGEGDPSWRILKLLAVQIGLPYGVLASTGPIVQSWFSRAYPDRSPYRLYALSNLGSLSALLLFPLLFEPNWGLRSQTAAWTWGFFGFAGLSAVGAVAAGRGKSPEGAGAPEAAIGTGRRVLWVLLPAFACAMLVSTTDQLCQDMVVVPFLWVLPLAAYLLSFILAFDHPRWFRPAGFSAATAGLVFVAATFYAVRPANPVLFLAGQAATLAMLFSVCMLCHGLLSWLKPGAGSLASYYVAIAGGGALGGAGVGLLAPRLFSSYLEWKLGMTAAYVFGWGLLAWNFRGFLRAHLNVAALLFVVAGTGLAFLAAFFGSYGNDLETVRNFHGKVTVREAAGDRDMIHGRVLHGRQSLDPQHRLRPTQYYVSESGVGLAIRRFEDRKDLRMGVVGLGVGTLAAWASGPTQSIRFYEINPEVERMARTYFTYLGECRARVEVAIGDARLLLDADPPQRFHVLALDAFCGNAPPTHLLTVEAMAIYLKHLEPDGVLAVNVSNRHLDLSLVVRGAARRFGLKTAEVDHRGKEEASTWVLCTRSEVAIRDLVAAGAKPGEGREVVWTDDRSDLFSVLRLR